MKKRLYEVVGDFLRLQEMIIENDGEITDDQFSEFDQLIKDGEEKVEGYGMVIRNLLIEADKAKAEADRIDEYRKMADAKSKRILNRVDHLMRSLDDYFRIVLEADPDEKKIVFEGDAFKFQYDKKRPAYVIKEGVIKDLPDEYVKEQEKQADMAKLRELFKINKEEGSKYLHEITGHVLRLKT